MRQSKVVFSILFVGLLVLALVMACGDGEGPAQVPTTAPVEATPTEAPSPPQPPTVSGAELLQERCTECHTLDRVQRASKTQAEWEANVERMRGYGAELTDAEAQTLVEYLAETYGP